MYKLCVLNSNVAAEIWFPIDDYPNYQVSTYGRVKNKIKELILQPAKDKDGYYQVVLSNNAKAKTIRIHRLVAQAFLPYPKPDEDCVNHKDEDRTSNLVENLEWCSRRYNTCYGTGLKRMAAAKSKPIEQFTKGGELVKRWTSAKECELQTKYDHSAISKCCRFLKKSYKGYIWQYAN